MGPAYRIAARVIHRLPFPGGTLRASLAGRAGAAARWRAWADGGRAGGPLLWAHAPSVGEALALEPVLARLRARIPGLQVVMTHTSPSVARYPAVRGVAHTDYLPLDEPGPMSLTLAALRPALLLFSRGDLWPELVHQAARAAIRIAVAGATVRARSLRVRWPARRALRETYASVHWLGAVSADDGGRWIRLGVHQSRVEVTGDPRHDQVVERSGDLPIVTAVRAWQRPVGLTVLAGSVEPADAPLLARAAAGSRADGHRWIVVPHETKARTIRRLVAAFRAEGVETWQWSGSAGSAPDAGVVVVVTGRGLLADLYLAADVAYVGGGFSAGRVHALCEPAAAGIPVTAGPRLAGVGDGARLARAGGALAVREPDALVTALLDWRANPAKRQRVGLAARGALDAGAAERTAVRLAALLATGPAARSRADAAEATGATKRTAGRLTAPRPPSPSCLASRAFTTPAPSGPPTAPPRRSRAKRRTS